MVDSSTVAFGLVALIGAFLGGRWMFIRPKILELQTQANDLVKKQYSSFEALLDNRKKSDRDPQQGLNIAALYFQFVKIRDSLYRFYKSNKKHEALDLTTIISLVLLGIINYPFQSLVSNVPTNQIGVSIMFLHVTISMYLIMFSFIFLVSSLRQINKIENQLGIGQPNLNP